MDREGLVIGLRPRGKGGGSYNVLGSSSVVGQNVVKAESLGLL